MHVYLNYLIIETLIYSGKGKSHANQPCECGFRKGTLPINML